LAGKRGKKCILFLLRGTFFFTIQIRLLIGNCIKEGEKLLSGEHW